MVIYGSAVAGSLGKLDISRNCGREELVSVVLFQLCHNLYGQKQTGVVHRYEYSAYRKLVIVELIYTFYALEGLSQLVLPRSELHHL